MSRKTRSLFNIKDLVKYASEAKQIRGGFILGYIGDMIFCARHYKMSYKEYSIYQFYSLNVEDRRKFLMMSDAQYINTIYNTNSAKISDLDKFQDKYLFTKTFQEYTGNELINLQTAGQKRFDDFVAQHPVFVSKSIIKREGDYVEKHHVNDETDLVALRSDLINKKEFLLEPYLVQHSELQSLYPESLNTLRVITFRDADDEVHILNVALKLGNGGIRDDYSRGGLFSVPNEDGVIVRPFVNKKGSIYESHPSTQANLIGFQIPKFDDALDFAITCANVVPSVRYVGWDIAILEDRFVLLDGNLMSKFFQIPPVVSKATGEEYHDLRGIYEYVMPELAKLRIKVKKTK